MKLGAPSFAARATLIPGKIKTAAKGGIHLQKNYSIRATASYATQVSGHDLSAQLEMSVANRGLRSRAEKML